MKSFPGKICLRLSSAVIAGGLLNICLLRLRLLSFGVVLTIFNCNLFSFTFYALNMDDVAKIKAALSMFVDLFGLERFDYETLVRFFITVRKNYRQVAYHNWTHGFHVANSIYGILKSSPGIFKPLEVSSVIFIHSVGIFITTCDTLQFIQKLAFYRGAF